MAQHRFRTAAIIGEWRASREQAFQDALRARQALFDETCPDGVHWLVPGRIERDDPRSMRH